MTVKTVPPGSAVPPRGRRVWRILGVVVLLAAAGAGLGWGGYRMVQAHQRLDALRAAAAGDLATAEPVLRRTLERDPNDVAAVQALARGLVEVGRDAEARPWLDAWVRLAPDDREAVRQRLECLRRMEQYPEALADAEQLLTASPDDLFLQRRQAELLFLCGRLEEAEKACRDYLTRDEGQAGIVIVLANIRRGLGDLAEAGALLDDVLRRQGNAYRALMARANVHLDANEPEKAIPLLERIVREDPTRKRGARQQLSLAYQRAGRPKDAARVLAEMQALQEEEVLRDAANSQPENLELQVRAARGSFAIGSIEEAVGRLQQVLDRAPDYAPAHLALAEYYEKVGQPGLGAEHRRRAGVEEPAPEPGMPGGEGPSGP